MLTKLSHAEYDYFDTISSENIECPIDVEYSLPDYCPDIQKILKCLTYPEISSYSFTQDKLMCEGKLVLHVQYMDGKSGTIRVCEISKEYSVAREMSQGEEKAMGTLSASCGHVVCRAVSARKLDIHIPIILTASISAHKHERIPCDVENLEKKTDTMAVSHAVNAISHQFVLEEALELSQGCPPIESIIRKSVTINNIRCTPAMGKIQLEGIADVCMIYRSFSETLSVEKMSYAVPFSQSIDTGGAEPDCVCTCNVNTCEFSLQPKEDSMGECTISQLYLKLNASICIYKHKELSLIVDAYSIGQKCEMKFGNVTMARLDSPYEERLSYKKGVFLSEDELEKLLDVWCDEISVTPYCEKNKINYRGKFNLCLTYLGKSKQIFNVTKTYDFTVTREFQEIAQRRSEPSVKLTAKDFRIVDGNNVEVTCEGVLISSDFAMQTKRILTSAELQEESESRVNGTVTVYYSTKDEELWEIGKRYAASVSSIIENNNLSDPIRSPGGALAIF